MFQKLATASQVQVVLLVVVQNFLKYKHCGGKKGNDGAHHGMLKQRQL